jgi:hypothetical protein
VTAPPIFFVTVMPNRGAVLCPWLGAATRTPEDISVSSTLVEGEPRFGPAEPLSTDCNVKAEVWHRLPLAAARNCLRRVRRSIGFAPASECVVGLAGSASESSVTTILPNPAGRVSVETLGWLCSS